MPVGDLRQMISSVVDEALERRSVVQAPTGDEFVSKAAVMKLLRVSEVTLWRMDKDGRLKALRIGRNIRYRRTDVDEFMQRAVAA